MDDNEVSALIKESYDLHYHIGPDILPRKHTVESLIKEEAGRIKGVVLKSHSIPTIGLINSVTNRHIDLIGSITLNYFMGGFNESAIYASAVMSKDFPVFVWFPTVHAENHLVHNKSDYEIPPEWVKDPNFKPRNKYELKAIKVTDWAGKLIRKAESSLRMMEKMGCIVATGHVSWKEAEKLTLECLERGLKVIVTHPMQRDIAMPLEVQKKLADKGAYIEYCYIMYLDRDHPQDYPIEEQVRCMREIGAEKVVLTSDGGQKRNPGPTESLTQYIKLLSENGLERKDFKQMLAENPKRILV